MAAFDSDAFDVSAFDEDAFDFGTSGTSVITQHNRRRRRCAILLYRRFRGVK